MLWTGACASGRPQSGWRPLTGRNLTLRLVPGGCGGLGLATLVRVVILVVALVLEFVHELLRALVAARAVFVIQAIHRLPHCPIGKGGGRIGAGVF